MICVLLCLALFLLTLGLGYYVCIKATEETKFLKLLGNIVAVIIMIGSLLGLAYTGLSLCKCQKQGLCLYSTKQVTEANKP